MTAETIAAVATAPGRGGIGVVRLSGPQAFEIGRRLTERPSLTPRRAVHTRFVDGAGDTLDDGIVIAFQGPASYTGEDVVELQGHGGPAVLDAVLQACLDAGARVARPGEFSERAFLNGRLDLAQAEAVADLIEAGSRSAARAAARTLRGAFSERVTERMEALTSLRVWVEAALDFPDEDIDLIADGDVAARVASANAELDELLAAAQRGVRLSEGLTVVLAGAPNAGKSSLLNLLAERDAAIVTDIPGTTRDLLETPLVLRGVPVRVIDTAGLRASEDPVEQEGVRRAQRALASADLLVWLVDAARQEAPASAADLKTALAASDSSSSEHELPDHTLVALNKCDLLERAPEPYTELPWRAISVRTGDGVAELVDGLLELAGVQSEGAAEFSARARHVSAIRDARAAGERAAQRLAEGAGADLVADDLRAAHDALGTIVGVVTPDDLLGEIFSSFCIGK